ncbi:unnamed protein product, partial [marine sediment metagenome]
MSVQEKVRWGILGCAAVAAKAMVPGIIRSQNGCVEAVAEEYPPGSKLQKAKEFAKEFDVEKAFASYDELLDDPNVQAVYLAQPNHLHATWTIQAAEKGKHVYCEKPLACSTAEAEEMVDVCQKQGVLLMVGYAHRFQPQNRKAKQLIKEGRIGKVLSIFATHSGSMPAPGNIRLEKKFGGGTLMDRGSYCVNIARYIFQSEPLSVWASAKFMNGGQGVDKEIVAVLSFPGGQTLQFTSGFSMPDGNYCQSYEIVGQTGR